MTLLFGKINTLVSLALAARLRKYKRASLFFRRWVPNVFPDKNRDDFHSMQMSLTSMRFIFGDDWNDVPCSIVPVPTVRRNLRSRRDCVRYLLSPPSPHSFSVCFMTKKNLVLIVPRDILICFVILVCVRDDWQVLGLMKFLSKIEHVISFIYTRLNHRRIGYEK